MILDSIISIDRLTKDEDNPDKESYQPNAALQAVKCNIQPASPEQTAIANGIFGQTYACFTTESGIKVGDKVTVSGTGEVMRVKGIQDWSQSEGIPHFELTLARFEEEEV
ncbi:MAG: hypothetical protein ACTSYW_10480 [Candidatus Heimdallarchaeota archaeon]